MTNSVTASAVLAEKLNLLMSMKCLRKDVKTEKKMPVLCQAPKEFVLSGVYASIPVSKQLKSEMCLMHNAC